MQHVHLIGIGGSGLSAVARFLLESGYQVSGSDRELSPLAKRLQASGVEVFLGHRAAHVMGADVVVRSSAIPEDNVEVRAAEEAGIPVLKRADFLGRLMEGRRGIAVAGTHGKTTTTAMIAWMLTAMGEDPSFLIGGVSENLGTNARSGKGDFFVIEADEYDYMFLGLHPEFAIVTNVEHDHPDCFPTAEDFFNAFVDFADLVAPDGVLLTCGDDHGAALLRAEVENRRQRALSYSFGRWLGRRDPEYLGRALQLAENGCYRFAAFREGRPLADVALEVPGKHNAYNALAALALADLLGMNLESAAAALGKFHGTGRRFELRGEAGGVTVIDDYAHHPTEVRATLAAARARYPDRRMWVVWQPHTYSRTRLFADEFADSFENADVILVTEVYAAREPDPGDFSAREVVALIKGRLKEQAEVHFVPELVDVTGTLLSRLEDGDVLIVLSAGDADQIGGQVLAALAREENQAYV